MRENSSSVERGKDGEAGMGANHVRLNALLAPKNHSGHFPARGGSVYQALDHVPWKPSGHA
jgi:hypothetical protein